MGTGYTSYCDNTTKEAQEIDRWGATSVEEEIACVLAKENLFSEENAVCFIQVQLNKGSLARVLDVSIAKP